MTNTRKIEPFVISRVFDAPRDRVWKAWTEVERLKQWFSPKGFTIVAAKIDFRVGGTYHYGLRMPDGKEMWGRFVYREIARPERLVWINSFSDKDGGLSVHPMNPNWPREMLTTATFKDLGGKTEVTIQWIPVDGSTELETGTFDQGRDSMKGGWTGTFEQFANYLNKG
jgi:uncharacterized protein YndB with AHSA1/START domain